MFLRRIWCDHRFYTGSTGSTVIGVAQLLTFGDYCIGIDFKLFLEFIH